MTGDLFHLRRFIVEGYDLDELRTLCFDLGVNYDNLPGETLASKARELILHLGRRRQLDLLLPRLQQSRPEAFRGLGLTADPAAMEALYAGLPSFEDTGQSLPPAPGEPPFKGLQFFDQEDAALFFGREQLTAELAGRLREERFLAVVGASGSGKSSLVRAGVVPAVRRGDVQLGNQRSDTWPIHIITPGDEPLKVLAATLTRDAESVTATATLMDDMRKDSQSLGLYLYRQLADQVDTRLLLVIDQFEELFTQCDDPEERRLFAENLIHAVQSDKQGRLSLILALRADFYAHAVGVEALRLLLETRQKIVGAMTLTELRQAIEGPAAAGDWEFQPGLVETILGDIGIGGGGDREPEPGALPLLSHALRETWERRQGRVMTLAGYRAAGGVRRAIATTADNVYAGLTPDQQAIARNIFLRLTELGEGTEDTRRRVGMTELVPRTEAAAEVQAVLATLADGRLVTTDEQGAEVAHEALIREWPTLRDWLDEDREGLRTHRQLTGATKAWEENGRDASYLHSGLRLARARAWAKTHNDRLNRQEWRFLGASQRLEEEAARAAEAAQQRDVAQAQALAAAEKRRSNTLRRALVVAFSLVIVAATFAFLAMQNAKRANEQAAIAQSLASQAIAAASREVGHTNDMRALLLAIEAGRSAETTGSFSALHQRLPFMLRPLHSLSHERTVVGATWNGDGSQILTWSEDDRVKIWQTDSGKLVQTLRHKGIVMGAMWNEEKNRILSWSQDGTAKLWDIDSGAMLHNLSHEGIVQGATWNEDGSRVLTWSRDDTAKVWDADTGKPLHTLRHESTVWGATWNEDASRILTWSADSSSAEGTANVWDAESGTPLYILDHAGPVWGATWNGDENRVLTWSEDGTAKVWDAESGTLLYSFSHGLPVRGATWNGDESRVLTWSVDHTAKVWDAGSGKPLHTLRHGWNVDGAMWNADESQVLTWGGNTAKVWDAESEDLSHTLSHETSVNGAIFNADESRILTWSWDGTARVWNAGSGALLYTLNHEFEVWGAMWNGDESRILTWSADGTAKVWQADSAALSHTLDYEDTGLTYEDFVQGSLWNGDGSRFLTQGRDNTAKVWDVDSSTLLHTLSHEESVNGARWNEDGSRILTWSDDGTAKVWQVDSGALLRTLRHDGWVNGARWSGDESRVITWGGDYSSGDGTAKVWNGDSGEFLHLLSHDAPIVGATWNGDGSRVLISSQDGTANLWQADSGALLRTFRHNGMINGETWNGDGSQVLTWSQDSTAKLWDADSEEPLQTLRHDGVVVGARWNEDKSWILTWSWDGTAKMWDAHSEKLLRTLSHGDWVDGATWKKDESQILTWGGNTAKVWQADSGTLLYSLGHDDQLRGATWNRDEGRILTWSEDSTAKVWDADSGEVELILSGDGNPVTFARWNADESRVLIATNGGLFRAYYTRMDDLIEVACERATRNLTWSEWQLHLFGEPYPRTCRDLPPHPSVPAEELRQ